MSSGRWALKVGFGSRAECLHFGGRDKQQTPPLARQRRDSVRPFARPIISRMIAHRSGQASGV
jgi:hypothetical protein